MADNNSYDEYTPTLQLQQDTSPVVRIPLTRLKHS